MPGIKSNSMPFPYKTNTILIGLLRPNRGMILKIQTSLRFMIFYDNFDDLAISIKEKKGKFSLSYRVP